MLKHLYITLLMLVAIPAFTQPIEEQIADYNKQIEARGNDTTKVRLLCELSRLQRRIDIDKAEETAQRALNIAVSLNNKEYLALSLTCFSYLRNSQGKYDLSIQTAKKGIAVLSADTVDFTQNTNYQNKTLGNLLSSIGMSYDYKSEYAKGIQYHLKSREAYKAASYLTGVCVTYNNIGISYMYLGDLDRSSENFNYAYDNYIKTGDTITAYQIKLNLGIIAHFTEDYETALDVFRECAANFKAQGNIRSMANAYANMSETFGKTGQKDSALYYIKKSVEIDEEVGDPQSIAMSYIMLGTAYLDNQLFNKAANYYDKALQISLELDQKHDIQLSYQKLAYLEQEKGDFKKALEYNIIAEKYEDTIQLENNTRKLGKIEAEHEFNKQLAVKEAENQQKLKVEAEKRRRQSLILYFVLGIIGVIMFFVYMLIKSLKQTRKQKELVEEARLEIEQKNEEMVASITYAKRIQNAILPPKTKVSKLLPDAFILYKPKDIVAGDFYWLEEKNGKVLFAAADCTGHGVPGAMVSVICNNGLNRSVREYGLTDPGEILNKTREIVVAEFEKSEEQVKDGMDIALCSLTLRNENEEESTHSQSASHFLKYAGAHNPLWIIRKGSGEIEEITANKQPIGKFENPLPYNTHEVTLYKGDAVYVFSDGYADQFGGEKGKKYKSSNFKSFLISISHLPMADQKEKLDQEFETWKGELEQLDDVCVIGVRV